MSSTKAIFRAVAAASLVSAKLDAIPEVVKEVVQEVDSELNRLTKIMPNTGNKNKKGVWKKDNTKPNTPPARTRAPPAKTQEADDLVEDVAAATRPAKLPSSRNQVIGLGNPASNFCVQNGGTFELHDTLGYCLFADGTFCEEWEFMKGNCKAGENPYVKETVLSLGNPASLFCSTQGGQFELRDQTGYCVFTDGSECEEWALMNGDCQPFVPPARTVGMGNPSATFCTQKGGTYKYKEPAGYCVFADSSFCEEWAFFRGECMPGDSLAKTAPCEADSAFVAEARKLHTLYKTLQSSLPEPLDAAMLRLLQPLLNQVVRMGEMADKMAVVPQVTVPPRSTALKCSSPSQCLAGTQCTQVSPADCTGACIFADAKGLCFRKLVQPQLVAASSLNVCPDGVSYEQAKRTCYQRIAQPLWDEVTCRCVDPATATRQQQKEPVAEQKVAPPQQVAPVPQQLMQFAPAAPMMTRPVFTNTRLTNQLINSRPTATMQQFQANVGKANVGATTAQPPRFRAALP